MRAGRDRRAAILQAEGHKQSQILTAEGDKQAAILRAQGSREAQVLHAEGQAKAIRAVADAIHRANPDPKLLAYQYVQALPQIAQGQANKLWIIPTELTKALEGIGGVIGRLQEQPAEPLISGEESEEIAAIGAQARAAAEAAEAEAESAVREAERALPPGAGSTGGAGTAAGRSARCPAGTGSAGAGLGAPLLIVDNGPPRRSGRAVPVTDPDDDRIADYRALTDVELRTRFEPPQGLFIGEGELVLRRAVRAGYRLRSILVDAKRVDQLSDVDTGGAPVYAASPDVLRRITGFHVHRGVLASFHRRALPSVPEVLAAAQRVVVLEDVNNHTNVGAIFRAAAGLGM